MKETLVILTEEQKEKLKARMKKDGFIGSIDAYASKIIREEIKNERSKQSFSIHA